VDGQFKSVSALKDLNIPLSIAGQGQSSDSNDNSISRRDFSLFPNWNKPSGVSLVAVLM
jgi:HAE1 family hydrophobic/amphiphilic exporter-1